MLNLNGNPLVSLPREIAALTQLSRIALDVKHCSPALQAAYLAGIPDLFAYLRSLSEAEPRYEAKLLLIGDGNAGKTSCLWRLIKGEFVERSTTHGIEVVVRGRQLVPLPRPALAFDQHRRHSAGRYVPSACDRLGR
jgi:hypothetical protein